MGGNKFGPVDKMLVISRSRRQEGGWMMGGLLCAQGAQARKKKVLRLGVNVCDGEVLCRWRSDERPTRHVGSVPSKGHSR